MGNKKNKRRRTKRSFSQRLKHMMEVLKQRRAAAAKNSATDVQFAELPPAIELEIDDPDVIEQQPTSDIVQVVEEPKPLPKLRPRRPPPVTAPMSTRSNYRVGKDDMELLAGLVRGHPVLYNTHCAQVRDKALWRAAWQDISTRMLRTDSECIAMWKLLKSKYSCALRIRKRKLEQGLSVRPSKYEAFMSFMKPYLKVCKTAPTTSATGQARCAGVAGQARCAGVAGQARCAGVAGQARCAGVAAAPECGEPPQRNTMVELFRHLGETVKEFPEDVKVRVKSEVLKVVSDARDFILSNNTVEQLFIVEEIDIKQEPLEL